MKIKIASAFAALLAVLSLSAFAAELPKEWNITGEIRAAWEIRATGFIQENGAPGDDLFVYCVLETKNEILEGTVQPGTPDPGSGSQDLFCWKHGVEKTTGQAQSLTRPNEDFTRKWTLCIDAARHKVPGSATPLPQVLDLEITRIQNSLPEDIKILLCDADGGVVADFTAAANGDVVTATAVPLGEYTLVISYERAMAEVSIANGDGIELSKGWNLVSLPFENILEANFDGKPLFDTCAVYRYDAAHRTMVAVKSVSALTPGDGLWVYLPKAGRLTGRGKCLVGKNSTLPEYVSGKWNFLGVVFTCNQETGAINPIAGKLPQKAAKWDAGKRRFDAVSGTPTGYVGYIVR